MVRLFVGGLAHDTTSDQLALRFQSFGKVTGCDVIGPKEEGVFRRPDTTCRGFGYLNLEPANDSALRKCLAVVCPCCLLPLAHTRWLLCHHWLHHLSRFRSLSSWKDQTSFVPHQEGSMVAVHNWLASWQLMPKSPQWRKFIFNAVQWIKVARWSAQSPAS